MYNKLWIPMLYYLLIIMNKVDSLKNICNSFISFWRCQVCIFDNFVEPKFVVHQSILQILYASTLLPIAYRNTINLCTYFYRATP